MVLRILFLAVLIWLTKIVVSAQSPQPNEPHTVVDYYMLLPDKYFEANRDERYIGCWIPSAAQQSIYQMVTCTHAQTDIYACLFKKSNGTYLMAVGYNDKDEVFETFLDFFVYDHGHMLNVTKNVFPVRFNKNLFYRWGTTIKVTNTSGKKLYDLVWTGSVFLLKRR